MTALQNIKETVNYIMHIHMNRHIMIIIMFIYTSKLKFLEDKRSENCVHNVRTGTSIPCILSEN